MVTTNRFGSVNEYLASKPAEVRIVLERVRRAIRKAVPTAQEGLSYQMPVVQAEWRTPAVFRGLEGALLPVSRERCARRSLPTRTRTIQAKQRHDPIAALQPVPVSLIERIRAFPRPAAHDA
jgi:hypothetical protein